MEDLGGGGEAKGWEEENKTATFEEMTRCVVRKTSQNVIISFRRHVQSRVRRRETAHISWWSGRQRNTSTHTSSPVYTENAERRLGELRTERCLFLFFSSSHAC